MPRIKTEEMFKDEMNKINPNIIILGEYINVKTKILVKDIRCNHEWETSPRSLSHGSGCPICVNNKRKNTTKQFKEKMKIVNSNIEVLGEYIGSNNCILVRDKICGHSWDTARASSLLKGTGCPYCNSSKKKTTNSFIKELEIKNPYIEILEDYINDATTILVRDKRCGHKWNTSTPNRLLKGTTCPKCAKAKKNKKQIKDNRVNESNYNINNEKMTIIKYRSSTDIDIKFKNGYIIRHTSYSFFFKRTISISI